MAKRHSALFLAAISLGALLAVNSYAATANNEAIKLHKARLLIHQFEDTQSASLLKEAVTTLASGSMDHSLVLNKSARSDATLMWIELFSDVDTVEDRLDGPAPALNVAPPDDSVAAGTDPAAVKDPKVRTAYERLIKANDARGEKRRAFDSIKKIDNLAETYFSIYVKQAYGTIEEQTDLLSAIAHSHLGASRKDVLKKLVING